MKPSDLVTAQQRRFLKKILRMAEEGEVDSAEQELKKKISATSGVEQASLYSILGMICRARGDFKAAFRAYEKAEKILPKDPSLKLICAELLTQVFAQHDNAIKRAHWVLQEFGKSLFFYPALAVLGLAYLKKNKKPEALMCLTSMKETGFKGLVKSSQIDLKLLEALLQKKIGQTECLAYLRQAIQFAQKYYEPEAEARFTFILQRIEKDSATLPSS